MYVRKFEADTLDEALKQIKKELGPDAIILKTLTNKGLKGAFKKKKIEITAAISEKSYIKKANVDRSLDDENREKFYSSNSSQIANMIDGHSANRTIQKSSANSNQAGYGKLGLNKAVNTTIKKTKNISEKMKSSLDDFLSAKESSEELEPVEQVEFEQRQRPRQTVQPMTHSAPAPQHNHHQSSLDQQELLDAREKIDELERKLYELTKNVERIDKREPLGVYQLRTTLRSLDINEYYIQDLIKKCCFELSDDQLLDQDIVFEFALREMMAEIQTDMPLFSSLSDNEPVITVLISETSVGQTSMIQKLGALKKGSLIIRNSESTQDQQRPNFTEKVFDMKIVETNGVPEIVSKCRKGVESLQSVFVDYKNKSGEINETKKFIDGLRRVFGRVEVLISLSAIHSEEYNRKMMNRYLELLDGVVISNLDLCLNYGAIFNIAQGHPQVPFKFYGTGEVVPDDIESATAERILAGVFKLTE